jgi:primosomal protein N' (replication factor Y)
MDSDSKSYNLFGLKRFAEGKYDILIGTQMISKGFNFPGVTLVGVVSADSMLYGSDFRSFEKAFSLFTQVIGRAGRAKLPGKAIIQSFSPENEVLKFAANQDYESFFESEIKMRKLMLYPPYSDICVVGFAGKKEKNVVSASREFFKILKNMALKKYSGLPLRILPPNPEIIKKVSTKFRYKIIIKCKNTSEFRRMISEVYKEFLNSNFSNAVSAFVDINPERIL